jgi:hypothetical protein
MGLSYSCKLVEALSSAVHWIVDNKLNGCGCDHVLDDFLFVGQGNSPLCGPFFLFAIYANLSFNFTSLSSANLISIFVRVKFESLKGNCSCGQDRFFLLYRKLKDKLAYIANRKKVTLGELLSLIGFLKFACAVVTLGRAY